MTALKYAASLIASEKCHLMRAVLGRRLRTPFSWPASSGCQFMGVFFSEWQLPQRCHLLSYNSYTVVCHFSWECLANMPTHFLTKARHANLNRITLNRQTKAKSFLLFERAYFPCCLMPAGVSQSYTHTIQSCWSFAYAIKNSCSDKQRELKRPTTINCCS